MLSFYQDKKEECLKFGAHEFLCSKDFTPEYIENIRKFDVVFDTVSVNIDWDTYLDLLDR